MLARSGTSDFDLLQEMLGHNRLSRVELVVCLFDLGLHKRLKLRVLHNYN